MRALVRADAISSFSPKDSIGVALARIVAQGKARLHNEQPEGVVMAAM
jgi:hypothetical protein